MSGVTNPEEYEKPMDQSAQQHINLKVKGQFFCSENMSGVTNPEDYEKPMDQSAQQHINLKVKGQDGSEVYFRIKRTTPMRKLMNAYCDRQSVDFNSIAFLFDGRRLRAEQTPEQVDMEDGDEIDAMLHQTGGTMV